ncbi:MAG TPA: hypothetical protein VL068_08085 [Microthrixaceae bacterium]|nr:hypothetical protein [Microthrixaceae bacterium]
MSASDWERQVPFAMDWLGWALFGLVATGALTASMVAAQVAGLTRLDLPLLLGTVFVPDPDKARVVGFFMHMANGQVFALGYTAMFALWGRATWWMGGLLGAVHGAIALLVIVPLVAGIHPRMATERAGLSAKAGLEPPGLLALNYGPESPLVAMVAHIAFGIALGLLISPT